MLQGSHNSFKNWKVKIEVLLYFYPLNTTSIPQNFYFDRL